MTMMTGIKTKTIIQNINTPERAPERDEHGSCFLFMLKQILEILD